MFSFLSKNVFQRRYLLNRDSTTVMCFIRFISNKPTNENSSFTVSYLIDSCGLSQEKAIAVSNNVKFNTSTNPDSVLTLLRNHGFMDTHISKLVENCPQLLSYKADQILQPKFEFFNSLGFSNPDLANLFCKDPHLLRCSLAKKLIPAVDFLKSVVHSNTNVISAIEKSTWILTENLQHALVPNVEVFRAQGVPDSNISKLLVKQPRTFLTNTDRFKMTVEEVLKMEFDPSKYIFCEAVRALISISKSNREAKYENFRRCGWSEGDIHSAFRMQPKCMMISEKNVMHSMEFFVKQIGCAPSYIARHPTLLSYSIEKRISPRWSVLEFLKSSGLVKKDPSILSLFPITEKDFLQKYVAKYEKNAPDILSIYQGKRRLVV